MDKMQNASIVSRRLETTLACTQCDGMVNFELLERVLRCECTL